mmetsp:Transcript_40185/g.129048  ORF Transcript_40185/g.129048 Transcript_40185/m.129048 type:complete len:207 (+) Transcript_40185:402-1022(+)
MRAELSLRRPNPRYLGRCHGLGEVQELDYHRGHLLPGRPRHAPHCRRRDVGHGRDLVLANLPTEHAARQDDDGDLRDIALRHAREQVPELHADLRRSVVGHVHGPDDGVVGCAVGGVHRGIGLHLRRIAPVLASSHNLVKDLLGNGALGDRAGLRPAEPCRDCARGQHEGPLRSRLAVLLRHRPCLLDGRLEHCLGVLVACLPEQG